MKKILLFSLTALVIAACNETGGKTEISDKVKGENAIDVTKDSVNFTTVEWLDSNYRDMGKVTKGQELEVNFRFRNTGDKPLIISNVSAQCGCTIPETPKEPFAPGAEGTIKAKFNSSGQTPGPHQKQVYVTANTSPTTYNILTFNVDVVEEK